MQLAAMDTLTDDFSSIVRVAPCEASHAAIVEFSHTFDAYGVHGSLERVSKAAGRVWAAQAAGELAEWVEGKRAIIAAGDELRAAHFMIQRGWHCDQVPAEFDVGVEWALAEAIGEASGGLGRDDRTILR